VIILDEICKYSIVRNVIYFSQVYLEIAGE